MAYKDSDLMSEASSDASVFSPRRAVSTIEKLTPRHYRILDLCIAGMTPAEISSHLSMSPRQIGIIINSPSFQHQFSIRRKAFESKIDDSSVSAIDEVKSTLQQAARSAADKLVSGISSFDEKIALKSATEILDRTGYPKEQKVSGIDNTTTITINSVDFAALREALALDSTTQADGSATTESVSVPPLTPTQLADPSSYPPCEYVV